MAAVAEKADSPKGPAARSRQATRASALSFPNAHLRTNTVNVTSQRRQEILHKLKTIMFDKIEYREIPLGEVVRHLNERTRELDPAEKGVQFMLLSPTATSEVSLRSTAPANGVQFEEADLENVIVDIDPPLRDLPLIYVLDAIVKKADTAIQFAVTDYAVVIWPRAPGGEDRFFRTFRASPGFFQRGLEGVQGTPLGGQ